jgi:hypothetical protein
MSLMSYSRPICFRAVVSFYVLIDIIMFFCFYIVFQDITDLPRYINDISPSLSSNDLILLALTLF